MPLYEKLWYNYLNSKSNTDLRKFFPAFDKLKTSLTTDEQLNLLIDYITLISSDFYDQERAAFFQGLALGHALSLEIQNPNNK